MKSDEWQLALLFFIPVSLVLAACAGASYQEGHSNNYAKGYEDGQRKAVAMFIEEMQHAKEAKK